MLETIFKLKSDSTVKQYGKLYFEHLSADYRLMNGKITENADEQLLENILKKNKTGELTWEDIQVFDLTLIKYMNAGVLKGKLFNLRERYASLLNPAELEKYKSLKKADINITLEANAEEFREEYSMLVRDFCLRYMFIAGRERLRSKLLRSGAVMMLFFFLVVAVLGALANYEQVSSLRQELSSEQQVSPQTASTVQTAGSVAAQLLYGYATIAVVVFAGVTGAFVSMQQRIQSLQYGGDPVMDLSMMTHGWLSIFLSPLSGAIFAVVLYLFFAGNLLSGVIFPEFVVSPYLGDAIISAKQEPYYEDSTANTSQKSESPSNNNVNTVNNNVSANNVQTNTNSQLTSNSNTSSNSEKSIESKNDNSGRDNPGEIRNESSGYTENKQNIPMQLNYFVTTTGPKQGKDFALLLIWCFIAGFAERFVPDALMRLVDQKKKAEAT